MSDIPPRPRTEAELVEAIRSVDVGAPRELHERVNAMVADSRSPRGRRPPFPTGWRLGSAGAAVALAAIVLALVLAGGGAGGLSLRQASALTIGPATMAPPTESRHDREQLAASVDGIAFPYWGERFGWRSQGARLDRVGGRTVRTVFYVDGKGRRVGYSIVAGTPAPKIGAGAVRWRSGTPYRLTSVDGAMVVTWQRNGHLCVVSGRGVDGATLLALASWDDRTRA
jgi:hypothetical protein